MVGHSEVIQFDGLSPSRTSGAANSRDTIFPEICFLQFVAPVELRESVGSAARISYDRAPLVSAIGPLCISVMVVTDGWVLGFRGLPALYAIVMFALKQSRSLHKTPNYMHL